MKYQEVLKAKRYLPHWTQENATYWVTFRLGDALPQTKLHFWRRQRETWLHFNPKPWDDRQVNQYRELFTERIEFWLDAGYGSCSLRRTDCRNVVVYCILRFHQDRHLLRHAVVMPNHVHLLIEPFEGESLSKILGGMKGASSRKCNEILGRSGSFWMQESYDHIVRDREEFNAFYQYIDKNPMKAGLKNHEYWLMDP